MARRQPRPIMGRMSLPARSISGAAFGAFVGAWIGRASFVWILDVSRTWEIAALVAFGLAGAVIGVAAEREEAAKRDG
jgi:hypothetical protein